MPILKGFYVVDDKYTNHTPHPLRYYTDAMRQKDCIEIMNQLYGSAKKQFKIVTEKQVLQYWENENDC